MYGFKKDRFGNLKVTQASPRKFKFLPGTVLLVLDFTVCLHVLEFTVCLHLMKTVKTSLRQRSTVPL